VDAALASVAALTMSLADDDDELAPAGAQSPQAQLSVEQILAAEVVVGPAVKQQQQQQGGSSGAPLAAGPAPGAAVEAAAAEGEEEQEAVEEEEAGEEQGQALLRRRQSSGGGTFSTKRRMGLLQGASAKVSARQLRWSNGACCFWCHPMTAAPPGSPLGHACSHQDLP
jgi:hypothetical protein